MMKKMLIVSLALASASSFAGGHRAGRVLGGFVRGLLGGDPPPPPPPVVVPAQPVVVPPPVVVQQPVVVPAQTVVVSQPAVVQQPVAVPQPAVVQQPVVVPQPAAPAPQMAVPASVDLGPIPPLTDLAVEKAELPAASAPKTQYGQVVFKAPATAEMIAAVQQEYLAKSKPENARLSFEKVDDATLVAALAAFPQATDVSVDHSLVTSLAPFAAMSNLKRLTLKNLALPDLSPLAGLVGLERLDFTYSALPDLSPIGRLPNVKYAGFYGAKLADFTPLAGMPKLEEVYYYAVKMSQPGYQTLGNLKQVKKFHGGLTKMNSLAWVAQVPQIEELHVFAEPIADFSPVASARNLKYFRAWNMVAKGVGKCAVGDLAFLAGCTQLERLELPGSEYTGEAVIANFPKLTRLDMGGAKNPVNLAFAQNLSALRFVDLNGTTVANGQVLAALPALESLNLKKTQGIASIAPFAALPKLQSLTISKGAYPADEVTAVTTARKATYKYFKVNEY